MAIVQTIIAAVAVLFAAWVAGAVARSVKISEFRQAWINDQRKDIADYIRLSRCWYCKSQELNGGQLPSKKHDCLEKELLSIKNNALVILWRIKLRLNPRPNPNKAKDDCFYESLEALLNPATTNHTGGATDWDRRVDNTLEQSQEMLKREWEVTKRYFSLWQRLTQKFCKAQSA